MSCAKSWSSEEVDEPFVNINWLVQQGHFLLGSGKLYHAKSKAMLKAKVITVTDKCERRILVIMPMNLKKMIATQV
jgi:hypothetical protein